MSDDPDGTPSSDDLAEADLREARAFYGAKSFDAAERAAERVLGHGPTGRYAYDALDLIGDIAYSRSDHDKELSIAADLLARDPDRIEGHLHLGMGHLQLGNYEEAGRAISAGLERFPRSAYLAHLEARRRLGVGDVNQAIVWAKTAIERAPSSAMLKATLASCLTDAGRFDEARRVIAEAIARDPMDSYVLHVATLNAFQDCAYAEAEQHARAGLASDPGVEGLRSLLYRSERFKHPLMWPYWFAYKHAGRNRMAFIAFWALLIVVTTPFKLNFPVVGAFAVYYMVGLLVMRVIEARAERVRQRPPPRLKSY